MNGRTELIRAAITLAGGSDKVAERFGVTRWVVNSWARANAMPAEHVDELCSMGGGVIKADLIIRQMADAAAAQARARVLERARAAA